MARFTQTAASPNDSSGVFIQLSSTFAGGQVYIKMYPTVLISYTVGDFANAAAAASAGKVSLIPSSQWVEFGIADPTKVWVRGTTTAGTIYWDTLAG